MSIADNINEQARKLLEAVELETTHIEDCNRGRFYAVDSEIVESESAKWPTVKTTCQIRFDVLTAFGDAESVANAIDVAILRAAELIRASVRGEVS